MIKKKIGWESGPFVSCFGFQHPLAYVMNVSLHMLCICYVYTPSWGWRVCVCVYFYRERERNGDKGDRKKGYEANKE